MGSPLSPILSCIFLELFEIKYVFSPSFPCQVIWYRYVDDVFAVIPDNISHTNLLNYLNNILPTIKFTYEVPESGNLPFLDVLVGRNHMNLPTFTVYRKPTHTNSYIHWYSLHQPNTKLGILMSQFTRALKLCCPPLLDAEISHIKSIFSSLHYPSYFINRALRRAKMKYYSPSPPRNPTIINYLVTPSPLSPFTSSILPNNIKTVQSLKSLKCICRPNLHLDSSPVSQSQGIYQIPCKNCTSSYFGETVDFNRRLYQHGNDLRLDSENSALTAHRREMNHLIDIQNARMLLYNSDKFKRKYLESFIIYNTQSSNINKLPGEHRMDCLSNNFLLKNKRLRTIINSINPTN